MASSDEDDLEALRLAALATLKQKEEVQEPQGIQVLGSLSVQSTNQYHQDNGGMHPESYGYQDYGEVPFAFQQAVFKQQQMRGHGRGFQRGRGRGRGNRFTPKPVPQSALIVIQVEGNKDEQPKVMEKTKDSRPFLLRPQDKWASTEGSSQESTPTRPKDTSKFRRYDDETDSEEDEDVGRRKRSDSETRHFPINMSLEEISSDTEIEINKSNKDEAEIEIHNEVHNAVEIHNETHNNVDNKTEAFKAISEKITTPTVEENDNQTLNGVVPSEFQSDIKMVTSSISAPSSGQMEVNVSTTVNALLVGESVNIENEGDIRTVVKNKNIEILGDNTFESDSTPLRDEGTPLQDEPRQDDSVSNSYVTFSRFNRRNRRDSCSGSEESEEDDDAVLSNQSCKSHLDSDQESVNDESEDANNDITELESDVELKDNVSLPPTTPAKTLEHSQDSKSSVPSSAASKKSLVASDSYLSSSESASEGSSSSSESDSGASSVSSNNMKKSLTKTSLVNVIKNVRSETAKSKEDIVSSHHSRKHDSYQEGKKVNKDTRDTPAELDSVNNRRGRTKCEVEQKDKKSHHERSKYNDKKSHHDTYLDNHVKAAPEFDATNYRDKEMLHKGDKRQDQYDRKPRRGDQRSQEGSRSGWKRQGDSHSSVDRCKTEKSGGKDGGVERRHFEEICRLKMEEDKDREKRKCLPKLNEDRKPRKSNIDNGSKKNVIQKENTDRDSKQDIKKSNESIRQSRGDNRVYESKSVKTSKSAINIEESKKFQGKQHRKSSDGVRMKNSSGFSKKLKSDGKDRSKHKSVGDSWKSASESDCHTDSERSISSLSDLSSDSETESWRDKKRGAKRKTADIELEKRRRALKEREKRTESYRSRNQGRAERGNKDDFRNSRHRQRDDKRDRQCSPENNRSKFRNEDWKERRQNKDKSDLKQNYHRKSHEHCEDKPAMTKNFEELSSSDSELDVKKHRGVVSIVKSEKTKVSTEIPSLLQISVTKPQSDNVSKQKMKSSKTKNLIIHVEKSSDAESMRSQTKQKKKKKKDRKSWSSDEDSDEELQKQVVNVTFNEESKSERSRQSVYDRLGIPVQKTKHRGESGSGDASYTKRSHEEKASSAEKRVKLNESGKYSTKLAKNQKDGEGYDQDSVLNQRIQKIKEKNAEILRRKQLVEQDKQIYG